MSKRRLPLLLLVVACAAAADEALVAVATNFVFTAGELERAFEEASAHRITLTSGATGKLYAQVRSGAPYDVLLAADRERPALLEQEGLAVAGTRFSYAEGRLVLFSSQPERIRASARETLWQPGIRALAIANPALAPYGAAAVQVLDALGHGEPLGAQLVMGENVGQAFTLVATGNAELGLLALSQVRASPQGSRGAYLALDPDWHDPIRQDAVLLLHGADNAAARAFLDWLRGPAARELIAAHGYGSR